MPPPPAAANLPSIGRNQYTWSREQGLEMARRGREALQAKAQLRKAAGLPASLSPAEIHAGALLAILDQELQGWATLLLAERSKGSRANPKRARELVALIADLAKLEDQERSRISGRTSPANGANPSSSKLPTLAPLPSAVQQTPSTDPPTKLDAASSTSSTSSTDDLEPLTPEPIE